MAILVPRRFFHRDKGRYFSHRRREYLAKEGANKRVLSSQADSPIKISRVWTDYFSRKHLESAYLDRFFAVSGVIPGF